MHAAHVKPGALHATSKRVRVSDNDLRTTRIRERAYHLWERGDRHRHEIEDWLQAEREIDAESAPEASPKRGRVRTIAAAPTKTPKPKAAGKKAAAVKTKAKRKPKPKESFRTRR